MSGRRFCILLILCKYTEALRFRLRPTSGALQIGTLTPRRRHNIIMEEKIYILTKRKSGRMRIARDPLLLGKYGRPQRGELRVTIAPLGFRK